MQTMTNALSVAFGRSSVQTMELFMYVYQKQFANNIFNVHNLLFYYFPIKQFCEQNVNIQPDITVIYRVIQMSFE